MNTIFTIEDVIEYLACLGYFWDGKINKNGFNSYEPATISDFFTTTKNENAYVALRVVNLKTNKTATLFFEISDLTFKHESYADIHNPIPISYSLNWRKLLLNNHLDSYYSTYISFYQDKCNELLNHAKKKGLIFKKTYLPALIKDKFDTYQKLIEEAKCLKEHQSEYSV